MKNKASQSGWPWLLAGTFTAICMAVVLYVVNRGLFNERFTKANRNYDSTLKTSEKNANKPRFEFYNLLPKMDLSLPTTKQQKIPNQNQTKKKYKTNAVFALQAGSFQKSTDADSLKANLTLKGFDVFIKTAEIKQKRWHRVLIGPFKNSKQLNQARLTLQNNKINVIPIELNGNH